jgi:hypothetical protein
MGGRKSDENRLKSSYRNDVGECVESASGWGIGGCTRLEEPVRSGFDFLLLMNELPSHPG